MVGKNDDQTSIQRRKPPFWTSLGTILGAGPSRRRLTWPGGSPHTDQGRLRDYGHAGRLRAGWFRRGGERPRPSIDRECGADALPLGSYFVQVDEFGDNDDIPRTVLGGRFRAGNQPVCP